MPCHMLRVALTFHGIMLLHEQVEGSFAKQDKQIEHGGQKRLEGMT